VNRSPVLSSPYRFSIHNRLGKTYGSVDNRIKKIPAENEWSRSSRKIRLRKKLQEKIFIENQLEMTDHSHLGQLINYAAGLGAEYVIWIVRDVREEHQQAVDWLNEHTDEQLNFFCCNCRATI